MPRGFFVTGTDTGVGKTLVACALLRALGSSGRSVIGMKPVAAGSEGGHWPDVDALVRASNVPASAKLVSPYAFEPAIAPHVAAAIAGVRIDIDTIVRAYEELSRRAQIVVVEGVGGFLVPLNERETTADLAQRLALPVVLVVGMRLGCLNHALLTRARIASAGLRCAGWVANCFVPEMEHLQANIDALKQRLGCPLMGVMPFERDPVPERVAHLLPLDSFAEAPA